MANFLTIRNWSKFQHYKDRNPPWIKLSTSTFQNYEFSCLQDASKLLAVCIWTLASRSSDGSVPADFDWIKTQSCLGSTITIEHLKELINQGFIIDASNMLADCKQPARPETYREEAYSKETEGEILSPSGDRDVEEAISLYNLMAKENGLSIAQKVNGVRPKKLRARLKDCGGIEGWKVALEKVATNPWLKGENDKGWRADLDFMLQEKSFTKIMEGAYERGKGGGTGNGFAQLHREFIGGENDK